MSKTDLDSTRTKEALEAHKNPEEEMANAVKKKRIHRLTFILTSILAAFVCYLSAVRYFSWIAQTVVDRTDVHISEIPFPAVTLCPVMNVFEITKTFNESEERKIKEFLSQFKRFIPTDDDTTDYNDQSLRALEFIDQGNILNDISFKCEDFFGDCTWRRTKRNCCAIFQPIMHGKRLCYAFNSLTVKDPLPTWPWSESHSGGKSGLKVIMKTNASEAMLPKVMAMIHYTEEEMSTTTYYLQGVDLISVDAHKFYSDPGLRSINPKYRRCFFPDEIVKLQKTYGKCLRECRVTFLEGICNCTARLLTSGTQNKKYCTTTDLPCILEHRAAFFDGVNICETYVNERTSEYLACKCFPNCNEVQYKTFIRYDIGQSSGSRTNSSIIDLEVHFLRDTIFSYRTVMVYSMLDLLVAICSIIALFLGISFISVIKSIQDRFEKRRKCQLFAKAEQHK